MMFQKVRSKRKEKLASMSDEDLLDAVAAWVQRKYPVYKTAGLSKEVQIIRAILLLNDQVQNGGLLQFYLNGYAAYAIDYAGAFTEIGLENVGELIEDANGIYRRQKESFPSVKDIEQISKLYKNDPFEESDEIYSKYYDEIIRKTANYIRSHIELFDADLP